MWQNRHESPGRPTPTSNLNSLSRSLTNQRAPFIAREEDELDLSGDLTCFLMISLPQCPTFASSMMPSQNVPVQTSQNFPMTFQQPHTIAQQMQTTPSAGYPANPQGTWPVLQKLLTVCVCVCVYRFDRERVGIFDGKHRGSRSSWFGLMKRFEELMKVFPRCNLPPVLCSYRGNF